MQPPLDALPADAVLVHIGPHKTGTSSLQSVAEVTRSALLAHGVTYPGTAGAHHVEAKALRRLAGGWTHDAEASPDVEQWSRLVAEVARTPGRVLLSSEFFAQADDEAQARMVRDVGPERIHVLTAARNPAALATSTWQQVLRQGYPVTLQTWLAHNFRRAEVAQESTGFWSWADPDALVSRWSRNVDPQRITVVALDERDRRLLPRTVEQLLDLPEGLLADVTPPDSNRGLTAPEAALLQRVLEKLDSRVTWAEYSRVLRYGVLMRLLRTRRPDPGEARTRLPAWALDQAADQTERTIAGLDASPVRIVGDLASLRTTLGPAEDDAPITEVPLEAAAEALVGAVSVAVFGNSELERRPAGAARKAAGRKPGKGAGGPRDDDAPGTGKGPGKSPGKGPGKSPGRGAGKGRGGRPGDRAVESVPTRELAGILVGRVGRGARRRAARLRGAARDRRGT